MRRNATRATTRAEPVHPPASQVMSPMAHSAQPSRNAACSRDSRIQVISCRPPVGDQRIDDRLGASGNGRAARTASRNTPRISPEPRRSSVSSDSGTAMSYR